MWNLQRETDTNQAALTGKVRYPVQRESRGKETTRDEKRLKVRTRLAGR
jgi:hypothetical protein